MTIFYHPLFNKNEMNTSPYVKSIHFYLFHFYF